MELKPVRSIFDALKVRRIRNECRLYMTNYRGEISILQQIRWYFTYYIWTKDYRLFLAVDGVPVGYGALHKEYGKWHVIEGVSEEYRHQGYGTKILGRLLLLGEPPFIAEIWANNENSILLHLKAGFVLTDRRVKSGRPVNIYRYD